MKNKKLRIIYRNTKKVLVFVFSILGSPKPPFFAKSTYRAAGFLADQLTLFHPEGQIMPTIDITAAPPHFWKSPLDYFPLF